MPDAKTALIRALAVAGLLAAAPAISGAAQPNTSKASASTSAARWTALAQLPDWGGVWVPDVDDQNAQIKSNPPPWAGPVAAEMARLADEDKQGRPALILHDCLPYGMPALMLIPHNSMEVLFTPGRITILGESDGNRLRRIHTDGRKRPDDPDPTAHGYSIGHWEGDTLVVETTGVAPQSLIAISEAIGVPNDGGLQISERIRLASPNLLTDELVITAPKVLARPWKTTRVWQRFRGAEYEIIEGACTEGTVRAAKDEKGHDIFAPIQLQADGSVAIPAR